MGGVTSIITAIAPAAGPIGIAFSVLSFGLQIAGALLQKTPKRAGFATAEDRRRDNSVTLRSATEPRNTVIGEAKQGGTLVYGFSTGDSNKHVHLVIVFNDGPNEAMPYLFLDDDQLDMASRDGNGVVQSGKYAGLVKVNIHLGDPDQAADAELVAAAPGGEWTSAHRLRRIGYVYLRLEFKESVFFGGSVPQISAVWRGYNQIVNSRTGTPGWSQTVSDVVRWYLLDERLGMGSAAEDIDEASFVAAANLDDEDMDLKGGGTQKRYAANGIITWGADKPADIMEDLLTASLAAMTYAEWQYKLYPAAYRVPTRTIDERACRDDITWSARPERRQGYNRVSAKINDPSRKWQENTTPVRKNAAYEAEDGQPIPIVLDLPFTDDQVRAQRITEIFLRRSRRGVLKWPGNLRCRGVAVAEPIGVSVAELSWSGRVFYPLSFGIEPGSMIELELRAEDASDYAWLPSDELDPNQPAPVQESINPAGLAGNLSAQQSGQDTVLISWTEADPRPLGYNVYYGPVGGTIADARCFDERDRATTVFTAAIPPGTWVVYVVTVDEYGQESATAASTQITVQNFFDLVGGGDFAPDWPGTLVGFRKHWTGYLVATSTKAANQHTNEELFERFVPYPVAESRAEFLEPNEVDLGFDALGVRVSGSFVAPAGGDTAEAEAGTPPRIDIQYRYEGGFYNNWQVNWAVGVIDFRFLQHRLVVQSCRRRIEAYALLADVREEILTNQQATVPGGGGLVLFPQRFHNPPSVAPRVPNATPPLFVQYSSVTATGFSAVVVDGFGTVQTGPVDIVYDAVGPLGRKAA